MPSKGLPAGFVIRGVVRPPFGRRVTAEAHRVNPRWNAIFSPVRANWIKVGVVDISLFEKNILHYWNNHASRIG
jgi:hypothetical protein